MQVDPNLILGIVNVAGLALLAFLNLRLRNERLEASDKIRDALEKQQREFNASLEKQQRDFNDRLDKLRQEFLGSFIPAPVALEQRSSLLARVVKVEIETEKNRERVHDTNGKFQDLLLGPLQSFNVAMQDIARRMATYEERLRVQEEQVRDVEDGINDLQKATHK